MTDKKAKADVTPVRQRTQYTCMSTSLMMCLQALGHKVTEDEVNDVMGARPKKGAAWENALAAAQHYGCRATLVTPSTVQQLKSWTDRGIPVMIAWNPEGRPWSHASVVFDVDDDLNVYVADPNIPDPDETVRIVPKGEFYSKWAEKWPEYIVRRPAMAVEREITPEGRQVMASNKTAGRIDWYDLNERLDGVSIRLHKELLWTMGDLAQRRFREVQEDHLRYNMFHLDQAKKRTQDPSDLEVLQEVEDALRQYAKKRKFEPLPRVAASEKKAEAADCWSDYRAGGLSYAELQECLKRFEDDPYEAEWRNRHRPRIRPSGPVNKKQLDVLNALLMKRPGDRFIKSLRDQVQRGRKLSEKQLKAVRQNLYRNRMRSEADFFRAAAQQQPLMMMPDYGVEEDEMSHTPKEATFSEAEGPPTPLERKLSNHLQSYLAFLDDKGGAFDPSKFSKLPNVTPNMYEFKNEGRLWNVLSEGGWVKATPVPASKWSEDMPKWVELTTQGKGMVREIRKEQAQLRLRAIAHKKLKDLVKKLDRKYPEAQLRLGYIGNYESWGDDTTWYIFSKLSQPGSYGRKSYKWGGFPGRDPKGFEKMWAWASSNLEKAVQDAVLKSEGDYKGPPKRQATLQERWERGFQANDTDSGAGSDEDKFYQDPEKREVLEFARSQAISNIKDVAVDHAEELDVPLAQELKDVAEAPPTPTQIVEEPGGSAVSTLNRYVVKTDDPAVEPAAQMNKDRMAFWKAELEGFPKSADQLRKLLRELDDLEELDDNLNGVIDTFDVSMKVASQINPEVTSQLEVLAQAKAGIRSAEKIEESVKAILELYPEDKTAQRALKDAATMVARFKRTAKKADGVVRRISKKEAPPALRKASAATKRALSSLLVDPSVLTVIPWQGETRERISSNNYRSGQLVSGVEYKTMFRFPVVDEYRNEVTIFLHQSTLNDKGVMMTSSSRPGLPVEWSLQEVKRWFVESLEWSPLLKRGTNGVEQ